MKGFMYFLTVTIHCNKNMFENELYRFIQIKSEEKERPLFMHHSTEIFNNFNIVYE